MNKYIVRFRDDNGDELSLELHDEDFLQVHGVAKDLAALYEMSIHQIEQQLEERGDDE